MRLSWGRGYFSSSESGKIHRGIRRTQACEAFHVYNAQTRERHGAQDTMSAAITLFQISKTHADNDEICVTITREPEGTHIRLSVTPQQFADTLLTGRKVEANIIRWRLEHTAHK